MKTKTSIKLLFVFTLAILMASMYIGAPLATEHNVYPLMAGQSMEVGTVTISENDGSLTVTYDITEPGWVIIKAHLYVDTEAPKKGAPGQFPFHSESVHVTSYTFDIPLSEFGAGSINELYIAAHAEVNNENNIIGYDENIIIGYDENTIIGYDCPTLEEIAAALPESAQLKAINYPNADSYFDVQLTGGTSLDGTYDAFCIDKTHTIYLNSQYTANIYSSYETLPDTVLTGSDPNIDKPENLDLVNWVINQDFTGQGYTSIEVQNAIWILIDDNPPTGNSNSLAIVAQAYENGEGFVPGFGDELAVILQPVGTDGQTSSGQVTVAQVTIAQVTLLQLGLECTPIYEPIYQPIYQGETGWAISEDGTPFKKGVGWGSYFIYNLINE